MSAAALAAWCAADPGSNILNGSRLAARYTRVQDMSAMRKLPVVLSCRRHGRLPDDPETLHFHAIPRSQEGRFAIVTNVERGKQWTRIAL